MKSQLLLLLLSVVVYDSVNTTAAQSSGDCESNGGECKKNQKQCKETINRDYTCRRNGVCCIEEPQTTGCPEGFFALTPSNQCFKFFYSQKSTWFEANSTCQSEGLVMAQPSDPVTLRKYLVNKYGYNTSKGWPYVWLPARGTGNSTFQWQPNGGMIFSSNPYWYSTPSSSSFSTSYCIYMLSAGSYMKSYPTKPYYLSTCTGRYYYTICELVYE